MVNNAYFLNPHKMVVVGMKQFRSKEVPIIRSALQPLFAGNIYQTKKKNVQIYNVNMQ